MWSTPVFDSDEVADEAVGGTAMDKVLLRSEEPLRVCGTKLPAEVVEQRARVVLLLDLVEGDGVADWFYQTSLSSCHQHCVAVDEREENRERGTVDMVHVVVQWKVLSALFVHVRWHIKKLQERGGGERVCVSGLLLTV